MPKKSFEQEICYLLNPQGNLVKKEKKKKKKMKDRKVKLVFR